jgi:hypothetical protein
LSTSPSGSSIHQSNAFRAIALATLIAGVLDISSAFVLWGMRGIGPVRGLQIIATGIFGQDSFNRGWASAAVGLAAHFLIVFVSASLFYAASRKLPFLPAHPIVSGLAYGVAVYAFMTCIVVPLAGLHPKHSIVEVVRSITIVMLLVGLPISLFVKRFAGEEIRQD